MVIISSQPFFYVFPGGKLKPLGHLERGYVPI